MKNKFKRGDSRRISTCLLSTAVATTAAIGVTLPAPAASFPALHPVEVSDPVLAQMRGKFVSGGQIVYFGVEMITQFTTGHGGSYRGGLYVGIHRGFNAFRPTMTVLSKAEANDGGAPSGSGGSGNIQSGGLGQVRGVSQSVQVTGDANAAANNVSMNVSDNNGGQTGPSGSGWKSGTTQAGTGGGHVATQVSSGSAGVTVTVPGQGVARQNVINALGLQQQLQLSGNLNQVMNQMNLDVRVQAATAQMIAREGINNALASLRNLPGSGRF
ncbi:MAG: hypothetical protein P8Y64_07540 [Gammaproteobacteria bacterium]|jgi:hypothetical protein